MVIKKYRNIQLLRISLILFACISILYGSLHLFFPEQYVALSNAGPVAAGWIRWFGPLLICLGIAAIMVYLKPEKQGILITMFAIGCLSCGLTLLYSLFFDTEGIGNTWDTYSAIITNIVLSLLFFISLRVSRDTLW